jgi:hypothetical protein
VAGVSVCALGDERVTPLARRPRPIDLSPTGPGVSPGSPTLTWVDPGLVPATEFYLTIRDVTHGLGPESATVTTPSFQVPYQLETNTEYEWNVQAKYPGNQTFAPVARATFGTAGGTNLEG